MTDTHLWVRDDSPLPEEDFLLLFPHPPEGLDYSRMSWFQPVGPGTIHPPDVIMEWQRRLRKWKYGTSTVPDTSPPAGQLYQMEDGTYCKGTVQNTKHFQNKMGLEQTGVVDLPTDKAMLEYLQP